MNKVLVANLHKQAASNVLDLATQQDGSQRKGEQNELNKAVAGQRGEGDQVSRAQGQTKGSKRDQKAAGDKRRENSE